MPIHVILPPQKYSAEVTRTLEELMRDARAGRLVGLMYAARRTDRSHDFGMSGLYSRDVMLAIGTSSLMLRQLHTVAGHQPPA